MLVTADRDFGILQELYLNRKDEAKLCYAEQRMLKHFFIADDGSPRDEEPDPKVMEGYANKLSQKSWHNHKEVDKSARFMAFLKGLVSGQNKLRRLSRAKVSHFVPSSAGIPQDDPTGVIAPPPAPKSYWWAGLD